jgi:hypothetical protein
MPMDFSKFSYNDFLKITSQPDLLFSFFEHFNLLKHHNLSLPCPTCRSRNLQVVKQGNTPLGHLYRCPKRDCRTRVSLFKGTIFENKKIEIALTILSGFVKNKKNCTVVGESGFEEKTVYDYFSLFRKKCIMSANFNSVLMGGQNQIVEIDESHLFKRKNNRGNMLAYEHIWVFGIFERNSNFFLEQARFRDSQTLLWYCRTTRT